LARLRLEDGQFDDSDLTLCDLQLIEKAISKTLLGIYHGRIVYPSSETIETHAAPRATTA
jgi:membrane-associated HD superfamily phosphohydrolase